MNKHILYFCVFILSSYLNISAQVIPTNEWVNFYSAASTYDGEPIPIGSVVNAYDSDGIHCGSFEVHTSGQYGFLVVYRDDSFTPEIDEGAEPGDTLTFFINNHIAIVKGPGVPVWTANGSVIELNLEGHSNYAPMIIGFPDSLIFRSDSTVLLHLNDYVEDFNDPDSSLHWTISGNNSVIVDLDDSQNRVTLSAPAGWSGVEDLFFKVEDDSSAWDSDTIIVKVIGIVGINEDSDGLLPKEFCICQNYPNPFNPTTIIRYQIPKSSFVILSIYDINGRLIETLVNENKNAGYYSVNWNAENLSSGIYIYRIKAGEFNSVKKCLIVK